MTEKFEVTMVKKMEFDSWNAKIANKISACTFLQTTFNKAYTQT